MIASTIERTSGDAEAGELSPRAGSSRLAKTRCRQINGVKTVMIVDGDPVMRRALADVISHQPGCRVIQASGAVEAQRKVATENIDLLIMDLCAPETRDLQLALWFNAMHPETRILLASDSLWGLDFQLGLRKRIAFLAKPFTREALIRLVRNVLK